MLHLLCCLNAVNHQILLYYFYGFNCFSAFDLHFSTIGLSCGCSIDHTKRLATNCVVMQSIPTSLYCLLVYESRVAANDNRYFRPRFLLKIAVYNSFISFGMGILRTAMSTRRASYFVDRRMVPILSACCSSRSVPDSHSRFLCVQVQSVFLRTQYLHSNVMACGRLRRSKYRRTQESFDQLYAAVLTIAAGNRSCLRVFSRCMKVNSGARCETAGCLQGNSPERLSSTFLISLRLLGLSATPMVRKCKTYTSTPGGMQSWSSHRIWPLLARGQLFRTASESALYMTRAQLSACTLNAWTGPSRAFVGICARYTLLAYKF